MGKTIKEAKDHFVDFLELFNNKIRELQVVEAKEFNQIWNETYEEYISNLDK